MECILYIELEVQIKEVQLYIQFAFAINVTYIIILNYYSQWGYCIISLYMIYYLKYFQ